MMKTSERDLAISMIRLIATCCIVACHMMQWADFVLAGWVNVGMQIFLCMSGYLYGLRTIGNSLDFLKKNFKKILTDYYIVVTLAILALAVVYPEKLSAMVIGKTYLTFSILPGGAHLWYIPYILFCYLLTPIFNQWFDETLKKRGGRYKVFILLGGILIGNTLILRKFTKFNAAWVNCYILGMFFGKLKFHSWRKEQTVFKIGTIFFSLIMNVVQIVTDYTGVPLYSILHGGHFGSLYPMFCNYAHVFLGLALFIGLYDLFTIILLKNRNWSFLGRICAVSDKYSYRVYLVHQWVILGPFSLMAMTPWRALNIGIILICIAVLALIVEVTDQSIEWIKEWSLQL